MAKRPKIWFKKRTTRGHGRIVASSPKLTPKNLTREVYKNQRVYSYFLLKFVLFLILGVVWIRFGRRFMGFDALPVGALCGIVLAMFERFRIGRGIEIVILILAATASYFLDIGFVL